MSETTTICEQNEVFLRPNFWRDVQSSPKKWMLMWI